MPGEASKKTFAGLFTYARLARVLLLIGVLFVIYRGPEIVADLYSDHPDATLEEAQNLLKRLRKHPFVDVTYTKEDGSIDWERYNKAHPETIPSPGDVVRAGARWFAGRIMVWTNVRFYNAYLKQSNRLAKALENSTVTLEEAKNVLDRLRKHPFVSELYTNKDGTIDWTRYNKEHPETIPSPGDVVRAGARWFAGHVMVLADGQFYIEYIEQSNRLRRTRESSGEQ